MFRLFYSLLLIAVSLSLSANNIEVTNIVLTDQNVAEGTTTIQFDLSWENSWRISVGPANYDAAWVFAKFRVNGGPWRHATLSAAGATPAGATTEVADNLGAYIYRSADGSGDVFYPGVQLVWDYASSAVDPNAIVDVQVFAIEMVYVPEVAFSVGTGYNTITGGAENEVNEIYRVGSLAFIRGAYPVSSEEAITVGTTQGNLNYVDNNGTSGDGLGPIPASFPKGFGAFYCMKYEASQAQWIAFFNSLTQTQREALDITGLEGKNTDAPTVGNTVSWPDAGNATSASPDVVMTYVRNHFVLAYLDWAALRPMTELEYEKAGRGTAAPVSGEFAWGNANIFNEDYNLLNEDQPNEVVANPGVGVGNAAYSGTAGLIVGPIRCGALAASAVNANREETGGSFYGIMELSGNVYERCITIGNPEGRAFNGQHGDGIITAAGRHNVTNWPSGDAGFGYRGGSHTNGQNFLRISDRFDGASVLSGGNDRIGFRGVRTAN